MIVHHTELDATLWRDYSSRQPLLQKNYYEWNMKYSLIYMGLLIFEAIFLSAVAIVQGSCMMVLVYVIASYLSTSLGLLFAVLTVKWHRNTLYYASNQSKSRANIRAIVLLISVVVPISGSYFVVFERSCMSNSLVNPFLIMSFALQLIRASFGICV